MYRGTTPTHTFTMPSSMKNVSISELYITYSQNRKTIIEKSLSDVTRDGLTISVKLSQADTLKFTGHEMAYVQLRLKDSSNCAMASQWIQIPVDPIIKDGEI